MRRVLFIFVLVLVFSFTSLESMAKIRVGFVHSELQQEFQKETMPHLAKVFARCNTCELVDLTPYNEKGEFDPKGSIMKAEKPADIVVISWNDVFKSEFSDFKNQLSQMIDKGVVVIGQAGTHKDNKNISAPLKNTVLGQVDKIILLGDLTDRERLIPQSYYGPEMLSAFKTKNIEEDSAAATFAAELAARFPKKDAQGWRAHFAEVKEKSKRLWPGMNEFF